jgi:hypothetical protein
VKSVTALCVRLFYSIMALFRRRGLKRSASLLAYRLGPASNQITIVYEQDDGDKPGNIEILDEDSIQVRLRVLHEYLYGWRLLILIPREAVATLKSPLGNRKVLNEAGDEIPRA